MGSLSVAGMVGSPVRLRGILLGRPTDVVLDSEGRRAVGFLVESGDDAPRFLPFAASQPADGVIAVGSALMLFDDVAFYLKHGTSFRSLVGTEIESERAPVGALTDMRVDPTGVVIELEVESDGRRHLIPASGARFAASAATAA
jgi:hypothetical protein